MESPRRIKTIINGIAYNYKWALGYIKASFSEQDLKDLLDDALLFNPMISKKDTSDASEEIPEEARRALQEGLEKRKRLIEQDGRRGNKDIN